MSPNSPKLLGREIVLWLGVINAVVGALVGMKLVHWSPEQMSLTLSAIGAMFAVVAAFAVRPFPVPLLSTALVATLTMAAGFGLNITSDSVAMLNTVLIAAAAFFTRSQVSPEPILDPM